ncbi:hypothetical protein PBCVNW6652_990R [Paramecium bursaria Chlorella virus NW665.2]|nr:hypothetical protein PBCVNW6652_990R [Paramecium bursaria Chlorella virus NW665.2]
MSIKQFFSEHAKLYTVSMGHQEPAHEQKERYHVDVEVPEKLEDPVLKPEKPESKKHYHVDVEVPEKLEAPVMKPESKKHYHIDVEVPESIEEPVIAPKPKALNLWSPWAAKTKAITAPPAGETKYTLDHEMDAFNLWSPWAAKTKAAKGMAPLTERELENIKNKSWTVERRA